MKKGLVSILIPFKNTASYLDECLASILNQTYTDWEVYAVDDGSTDNSMSIVATYAEKDRRIHLLKNTGNGIIAALRTAHALAKGEFITRMDSDDCMLPQRLAHMVQALKKNGLGYITVGQVQYFSERGISNGYARYETWLNALTATGNNYTEIYKECVIPSPCWMTYASDLNQCNAFLPDRYPEDYDLTFRFYQQGLKIIPCTEVLHLWRDYDTRTSRTSEHYAQNYFLDIKVHYFLLLDRQPHRPLVVWGAGTKGKTIARLLQKKEIPFVWVCDNPNKIGKHIYGTPMVDYKELQKLKKPQSIITVANEDAQKEIRDYLITMGQKAMIDYYFFC